VNGTQSIYSYFDITTTPLDPNYNGSPWQDIAFGIWFTKKNEGSQDIRGTFKINALSNAEGIHYDSDVVSGMNTIYGVFSIVARLNNAFGVHFSKSVATANMIIGAALNVKSEVGEANGIRFENSFTGSVLNIDAICNVHAHKNAFGVYFAGDNATGSVTFSDDTYFSIYSDNAIAVGIAFNSTFQGTLLEIGGIYVVYSTSNEARGIS
jgi:hypothetical protein